MKKTAAKARFEFVLLINKKNIICQRYFDVNGFKDNESYDLKEMMDQIMGMDIEAGVHGIIPNFLKRNSNSYLWETFNPHKVQKQEDIYMQNIWEKLDDFQFEVKVDGRTIAASTFSGNYFPPKVRYQVDMRELIPAIISEIRYYLSQPLYQARDKKATTARK